jgi:hypothetical protein
VSHSYGRALLRFWWLLLLGILLAVVAGIAVISADRQDRTYFATSRLLVTSPQAPYFRITTTKVVEAATDGTATPEGSGSGQGGGSQDSVASAGQTRPVVINDSPDQRSVVAAANLYPLLIMGDEVKSLREDMFGQLPGTVTSRAIFAVSTPGRFELSDVPVVELTAEADTPRQALMLATSTSKAFIRYVEQQQDAAKLTDAERIIVQQLSTPAEATPSGSTPIALALTIMLAVLAAFVALVIALDRIFPRRPRPEAALAEKPVVEPLDRPAEATKP